MNTKNIGEYILKLRREKGLTQQELADKIYVTNKAVSRWENGLSLPEVETLYLLSKEFNVSINDILNAGVKEEQEVKEYYNKQRKKTLILDIIIIILITLLPAFTIISSGYTSSGIILAIMNKTNDVKEAGRNAQEFINSYTLSFTISWIIIIISYIGYKLNKKVLIYICMIVSVLLILSINLVSIEIINDGLLLLVLIIINIVELLIIKEK